MHNLLNLFLSNLFIGTTTLNGKIDHISSSMVRYHHTAGKELKTKSNYHSVIINNNQETNSHQIDFSIDREKEETASLKVKYNEPDEW